METTDLIARAAAGDHDAFRELVEPHSHELQVHCYRILGSLQDAEDALQETLVSAWRSLGEFGRRSSIRTWLYQIATNRCLSMLRADSRRPRIATPPPEAALPDPSGTGDGPPWLEPYPDVLLDHLVDQRPGPEARYESTEAVSLAFITALQLLPPRQRAVLVLRDVLGYRAAEVARMLDTTQESVQSALKRARATVDSHLAGSGGEGDGEGDGGGTGSGAGAGSSTRGGAAAGSSAAAGGGAGAGAGGRAGAGRGRSSGDSGRIRRPDTAAEQRLVARFTDALERSDLEALIDLLVTDVRLSMPPAMLEFHGIESARRLFAAAVFGPGRSYRVVPSRANGQPAFGLYLADSRAGVYRAYTLLVITTAGDRITAITGFHNTEIMTRFGMPRTLPDAG